MEGVDTKMKGTLINGLAIIGGSLIGLTFKKIIPKNIQKIMFQAIGLFVVVIGLSMALKTENPIILIFSLVLGSIIGEAINIEKRLEHFGNFIKSKVKSKDSKFVESFVTSSLVVCVGALAIIGPIEEGVKGDSTLLYTKSMLDGLGTIAFSSVMGIGVLFSFIPAVLYQGSITLLATSIKSYLTNAVITEMSAAGGALIFGIGLSILEIKKIKTSNMLPSIVVAAVLAFII